MSDFELFELFALLTRKVLTTQRPGYLSSLIRVNQPTMQTVTTIYSPGAVQHSTEDCVCESGFLSRGSCGLERTA